MAEEHQNRYTRKERFIYPIRAIKPFSTDGVGMSSFFDKWTYQNIALINQTSQIAKLAADGIVKEGKLLNQENKAQEMADELIQCGDAPEKIRECAIKLYTKDTFLYTVLNTTLRNGDISKVENLGPICFLLNSYLNRGKKHIEEQTIYRGMTLTAEMIEEYNKAVGEDINWPAFTSATKNRAVADMFGLDTLCIITIPSGSVHARDISDVSNILDEEEFLLSIGYELQVKKVEFDQTTNKHLIYLKSTCYLPSID